eukprot:2919984-Rhodomonas_salina.2
MDPELIAQVCVLRGPVCAFLGATLFAHRAVLSPTPDAHMKRLLFPADLLKASESVAMHDTDSAHGGAARASQPAPPTAQRSCSTLCPRTRGPRSSPRSLPETAPQLWRNSRRRTGRRR